MLATARHSLKSNEEIKLVFKAGKSMLKPLILFVIISLNLGISSIVSYFFLKFSFKVYAFEVIPTVSTFFIMVLVFNEIDFVNVDFKHLVTHSPKTVFYTLFLNFVLNPFAAVGFFRLLILIFPSLETAYEGCVYLFATPCTAMVFVWNKLYGGNSMLMLKQVVLNDIILLGFFPAFSFTMLGYFDNFQEMLLLLVIVILVFIVIPILISLVLHRIRFSPLISEFGNYVPVDFLLLNVLLASTIISLPELPLLEFMVYSIEIAAYQYMFAIVLTVLGVSIYISDLRLPLILGVSNFFELAVITALSTGAHVNSITYCLAGLFTEIPIMLSFVVIILVVQNVKGYMADRNSVCDAGTAGEDEKEFGDEDDNSFESASE